MNYADPNTYQVASTSSHAAGGLFFIFLLLWILIALAFFVLAFIGYWKIITKAGYNGAWVLIWFVPLVNIVFFFIFAFSEWPIQKELKQLKNNQGSQPVPVAPNTNQVPPQQGM